MWEIKGKDNQVKATVGSLEYNGEWMGESYVTVTLESPAPVNFEIGDYIIYRDERFEINYDPGKIKSAPRYEKGDAFKYENIKFNSLADELTRCDFLDIVLEDNQIHFTGLPKFSFYGGVKDLANRMQANLDRTYGKGTWSVVVSPEFQGDKELNVQIDNIKVQGALEILVNQFETYYTISGRTITIGAAGIPAAHLFKYGKGNGLYGLEQNAETDQAIVTRLRAYGSTRNLPHRYYNNIPAIDRANAPVHSIVSRQYVNSGSVACVLKFRLLSQYVDLSKCVTDGTKHWFSASINNVGYAAYWDDKESCYTIGERPSKHVDGVSNALLRKEQMEEIVTGTLVSFAAYKDGAPGIVTTVGIPDNMAVQYLMLPSFPYTTQDPYIDSPNIDKIGIREDTVFFDGSQEDLEEIYPSIEGMTAEQLKAAGVPCNSTGALDEIVSAEQMTDNGVGEINEGETQTTAKPPTFKVTLKDLGFDINNHFTTETATLSFKTGMLGGRDFEIVGCKKIESGGKVTGYELELNRVYDDGIKLWFPYSAYNAQAGDKFVLLYIKMPEVYIKAAAQRLKEAATEWLSKNDYSRSIYAPKVDEIFMARQHDLAMASGGKIKSLHDTLKEGMLLLFEDEDLNIDASIFIDRLTIKEEGAVPTYEVVLKEEKTVGRLDKMQNQIDSLVAGKGQGGGGYTAAQIRSMIDAYGGTRFLSKIKSDRTPYALNVGGRLVGEAGVQFGATYIPGIVGGLGAFISGDGNGELESLVLRSFLEVPELRYNRITVTVGNQWQAPGAGIVGEYTHGADAGDYSTGAVRLKLEEGETGSFAAGDICMGIWHYPRRADGSDPNDAADHDSGDGEFRFAGFRTVYFRVDSVSGDFNEILDIRTRPGHKLEPVEGMHIVAYGNTDDASRQSSCCRTRTYTRYLRGVNDWTYTPASIAMQTGDLTNLVIEGTAMSGYSAYLNNVYFDGVIRQIEDSPLRLTYETYGDKYVGDGDDCLLRFTVIKGVEDVTGECVWEASADTGASPGYVSGGGTLRITKAVLAGRDEATVTVTARWRAGAQDAYRTATATILIRDNALLRGEAGSSYTVNLLTGSRTWKETVWYTGAGSTRDGSMSGLDVLHAAPDAAGVAYTEAAQQDFTFEAGKVYTLSFWARGTGGIRTYCYPGVGGFLFKGGTGDRSNVTLADTEQIYQLTTEWKRHSLTFRVDGTPGAATKTLWRVMVGNEAWIAGAKLEEGENTKTAWSPAPEDMEGEKGDKGDPGADAVTWEWEADPGIVRCDATGVPVGGTLNVKCWRVKGETRTRAGVGDGLLLSPYLMQVRVQTDSGVTAWRTTDGTVSLDGYTAMDANPKFMFRIIPVSTAGAETVLTEYAVGHVCDGQRGESVTGPAGAVVRVRGLFAPGYYCDGTVAETTSGGASVRWLDVVWVENAAGDREFKRCTIAGTYTAATGPKYGASVKGWREFSSISNLVVELLMARNARIEFIAGQEIVFGDTQGIWGRIGVPVNDIIMYAGGEDTSVASYVLDRLGGARFGKTTGNHIVLDPSGAEGACLTLRKAGGSETVTIDGATHTVETAYGINDAITPESLNRGHGLNGTETIDAGTLTLDRDGGTLKVSATVYLWAQSAYYLAKGPSGSSDPATGLPSYARGSATVTLRVLKNGATVRSMTTRAFQSGITTDAVSATETLTVEIAGLTAGTYAVQAEITVSRQSGVEMTTGATVTAGAMARLYGGTKLLTLPEDYKSYLGADGLTVAASAADYLRAAKTGAGFAVEASAGQHGIRVTRSEGLMARDRHGAWNATVMTCDKTSADADMCVGERSGERVFLTGPDTRNLPAAGSKYGAITTVTINAAAGHHIQTFLSFSTSPECWARRCMDGTWGAWSKKY